jgi:hypothetical protein
MDPAMVRFSRPSTEGEAEAYACSIVASLFERPEQFVNVCTRRPPHSSWTSSDTRSSTAHDLQRDGGSGSRKLEGVLQ